MTPRNPTSPYIWRTYSSPGEHMLCMQVHTPVLQMEGWMRQQMMRYKAKRAKPYWPQNKTPKSFLWWCLYEVNEKAYNMCMLLRCIDLFLNFCNILFDEERAHACFCTIFHQGQGSYSWRKRPFSTTVQLTIWVNRLSSTGQPSTVLAQSPHHLQSA